MCTKRRSATQRRRLHDALVDRDEPERAVGQAASIRSVLDGQRAGAHRFDWPSSSFRFRGSRGREPLGTARWRWDGPRTARQRRPRGRCAAKRRLDLQIVQFGNGWQSALRSAPRAARTISPFRIAYVGMSERTQGRWPLSPGRVLEARHRSPSARSFTASTARSPEVRGNPVAQSGWVSVPGISGSISIKVYLKNFGDYRMRRVFRTSYLVAAAVGAVVAAAAPATAAPAVDATVDGGQAANAVTYTETTPDGTLTYGWRPASADDVQPMSASGCNEDVCISITGTGTYVSDWNTTAYWGGGYICTHSFWFINDSRIRTGNGVCGGAGVFFSDWQANRHWPSPSLACNTWQNMPGKPCETIHS